MILYHGGTIEVKKPDVKHSFRNLDFGKGFYVTSVRKQAERWAKRKSSLTGEKPVITEYECADSFEEFKVLNFKDKPEEWLDFVCACRDGDLSFQNYDVIIGKVADDKVYRVVDMYKKGIWDKTRAIQEMRVYETYDQFAFITQNAIDKFLKYKGSSEVE